MEKCTDDKELVEKARGGCRQSLEALTLQAQDRLDRFFGRLCQEYHLCQDLIQETLLAMITNLSGLQDAGRFWPWLYRIGRNKYIQYHRDSQRRNDVLQAVHEESCNSTQDQREKQDALEVFTKQEEFERLENTIEQLPVRHKQIIKLRCIEQESYRKIASTQNDSVSNLRVRFFRARQELKAALMSSQYFASAS